MKKDEPRFTIRFNPVDPRHQKAMNALEVAGRRKASLIADAVCEYLARHEGNDEIFSSPFTLAPTAPPKPHNAVSEGDAPSRELMLGADAEKSIADSEDMPFGNDMCQAILDGLNAFKL